MIPSVGTSATEVLQTAGSAELRSEHPLGKAIVARASVDGCRMKEPDRFDYSPGLGIAAVVEGTTILVGNRALMTAAGIEA